METCVEKLVSEAKGCGPLSLRAAARLMSVMTDQPQRLGELLAGSNGWPEPRLVLGVTGAPGSGKSTLVDHLAIELRLRYPDRRLGIVAVDPSSPFTGGAILGDRVRMMRHSTDPNIFIRSLASRGHLGGLTLGVKGVVRVMGLIGCDMVIVETVGVGQSEIEIARNSDLVVVVLAPGQGDSVQLLKAGLMEAGDLFVVNKADRSEAAQLHQQLLASLQTSRMAQLDFSGGKYALARCHDASVAVNIDNSLTDLPPTFLCSASHHEGISTLIDALERIAIRDAELWRTERKQQAVEEIRQAVLEEVRHRVSDMIGTNGAAQSRTCSILDGTKTLTHFVDELLRKTVAEANVNSDGTVNTYGKPIP
jgi:LAO/AO transport system kinase